MTATQPYALPTFEFVCCNADLARTWIGPMDQRELDHMLLDLLPPDGRATLEECIDELLQEEGCGKSPAHIQAAARAFNQKGCDEALPIDKQLVAHQMAAALRQRAEGLLN